MSNRRTVALDVDVSSAALAGCHQLRADIHWDLDHRSPASPALFCLPGGGMSRRYFDLAVDGYSMADHLARRGFLVVTMDHPAVGDSDVPDEPWSLTPEVVADVDAAAVRQVLRRLADGSVHGLPAERPMRVVGIGHSAGALVLLHLQARNDTFDSLGLLGWAGHGLPEHLGDDALELHGRLDSDTLVAAARRRHSDALVDLPRGSSALLNPNGIPEDAHGALVEARSRLLAVVGFASIVPGSAAHVTAEVEVPVFLAVGDHDIARRPLHGPVEFPRCPDMTVFVLDRAGHNHNVEPGRARLWDRLAAWIEGQL